MTTLEDIARELGVSKGTVSKALNGARDVSGAMRAAVLEKAAELGYTRLARGGSQGRIALFVTNMEYTQPEDFGYDLVEGFRRAAEPAGYQVEIVPLTLETEKAWSYDSYMLHNHFCAGFHLGLSQDHDPWIRDFESCRTPTVLYDNHVGNNPHVTSIGSDNQEGMDLAVGYLKELGHRRIGYLSYELRSYIYRRRYYAFLQAMAQKELTADEDMVGAEPHVSECLTRHLPRLLEGGCTAIVCSHDVLAHSVMVHCRELGLRIPEDVSILGYDDAPLCRYTVPTLTTVRQDRVSLGKSAFFAITSQMNHVWVSSLLLHGELIRRGSCGPVPERKGREASPSGV